MNDTQLILNRLQSRDKLLDDMIDLGMNQHNSEEFAILLDEQEADLELAKLSAMLDHTNWKNQSEMLRGIGEC